MAYYKQHIKVRKSLFRTVNMAVAQLLIFSYALSTGYLAQSTTIKLLKSVVDVGDRTERVKV